MFPLLIGALAYMALQLGYKSGASKQQPATMKITYEGGVTSTAVIAIKRLNMRRL